LLKIDSFVVILASHSLHIVRNLDQIGTLIIEVPDHSMNYKYHDYGLWEEHINYFTLSTLSYLLSLHGFHVFAHEVTIFSGQAITVYCKRMNRIPPPQTNDNECHLAQNYVDQFPAFKSHFVSYLEKVKQSYKDIYVYGAGCRSMCLVSFLECKEFITGFIDDSCEKSGKIVPGSNLPIYPYSEQARDSFILLGVSGEVEHKVIKSRSLEGGKFASILPPSPNLPYFWLNDV
jgi:hypothetical protein